MSVSRIRKSEPRGFEPWSSQTNEFIIDTWCFLARCLALLVQGKNWLAQCQDNVTEWDGYQVMVLVTWSPSEAALLSCHECALSQVSVHPYMTLDFARS